MKLPGHVRPGEPLSAQWGNDVVDALRALVPRDSPDITSRTSNNGTTFALVRKPPAPARTVRAPFTVYEGATAGTISVVTGQVHVVGNTLVVPTLGGTALDNSTPPTAAVVNGSKVYLRIERDDDEDFVECTIDVRTDTPTDDFHEGWLLLATVAIAGDVMSLTQAVTGNKVNRKVNIYHLWGAL